MDMEADWWPKSARLDGHPLERYLVDVGICTWCVCSCLTRPTAPQPHGRMHHSHPRVTSRVYDMPVCVHTRAWRTWALTCVRVRRAT